MYLSDEQICGMNVDLALCIQAADSFSGVHRSNSFAIFFPSKGNTCFAVVYSSKLVWPLKDCGFVLFGFFFFFFKGLSVFFCYKVQGISKKCFFLRHRRIFFIFLLYETVTL